MKELIYNYDARLNYFFSGSRLILGQYRINRENQNLSYADLADKLMLKYGLDKPTAPQSEFIISNEGDTVIHFTDNGFSIEITVFDPKIIDQVLPQVSAQSNKTKISIDAASVTF